jgi:aquaporin Z
MQLNKEHLSGALWDGLGTYLFLGAAAWLIAKSSLPASVSVGLSLAVVAAVIGPMSGGHFNPAVTTGMKLGKQFPSAAALLYVAMQIVGACAAMATVVFLVAGKFTRSGAQALIVEPAPGVSVWNAAFKEAVGTWILVSTVLAVGAKGRIWAPVIGASLGIAVQLFGADTGGGFNPARALAAFIVSGTTEGWAYMSIAHIAGPLVGAAVAALMFAQAKSSPAAS